jgi:hypothetical protein
VPSAAIRADSSGPSSFWKAVQQQERGISDRERAGLRGPVVKVVEERLNEPVAFLIRGVTRITTLVAEYDDRGAEVLREESREWNGELLRRLEHRYDALGRVVESTEDLFGVTKAPDFFGHIGRAVESPGYQETAQQDFSGPAQSITRRYRYEGDRLAEVDITDTAVGQEVDRRIYEYDIPGRRVKVYSSNGLGDFTPASVSDYREGSDGTVERLTTYSLYGMERVTFDAEGRVRRETIYAGRSGPPRYSLRYDRAGREVERLDYDRSGALLTRRIQTLDGQGNPTEISTTAPGRSTTVHRFVYRYDGQGNWTSRTETAFDPDAEGPSRSITVERTITYAPAHSAGMAPQTAEAGRGE